MGLKKLRQKAAAALVVIMSMSSALSAAAASDPFIGVKEGKADGIKITFDPNGGKWTEVMATRAVAHLASESNGDLKSEVFYEIKDGEDTATTSDAPAVIPDGMLKRKFFVQGWHQEEDGSWGAFSEFVDDDDRFCITLEQAKYWFEDGDWEKITHPDENLEFDGWYYGEQMVDPETTRIYNGDGEWIKLTAKWSEKEPEPEKPEIEDNLNLGVEAKLPDGAKLIVDAVQNKEKYEAEGYLEKILGTLYAKLKFTVMKFAGIDIRLENAQLSEDGLKISLNVPEALGIGDEEFNAIKENRCVLRGIHFAQIDGEEVAEEVQEIKVEKADGSNYKMSFSTKGLHGFSPFYFVLAETEAINEPDSPKTPSGSGSSGRSSSSTKEATMNGKWVIDENGWKFLKDSGEYAVNTWGYIKGHWYFFNTQGNMATGWQFVNNQWYYMNPAEGSLQGIMLTGWIMDSNYSGWFYLNENGAMVTGWNQIGGKWYYMNPISDGTKGIMAANTYIDSYYVGADGVWIQ